MLTPFEKNIEVWRQLWRVLERSDIVVQVTFDPLSVPDSHLWAARKLCCPTADVTPINAPLGPQVRPPRSRAPSASDHDVCWRAGH